MVTNYEEIKDFLEELFRYTKRCFNIHARVLENCPKQTRTPYGGWSEEDKEWKEAKMRDLSKRIKALKLSEEKVNEWRQAFIQALREDTNTPYESIRVSLNGEKPKSDERIVAKPRYRSGR